MVTSPVSASAQDTHDLSERIAAGTRAIWPDMQVLVEIEGCRYRMVEQRDNGVEPFLRETILNLRDVDVDPDRMFREGQRMGDTTSGREWITYNAGFFWRDTVLAENRAEIRRLAQDVDNLWEEPNSGFLSLLFPPDYQALEVENSEAVEALFQRVLDGEYGEFLKHNYSSRWMQITAGRVFSFDLIDEEQDQRTFSFLFWVLNDDVIDGIVSDIARYTETYCSPRT